MSGREGGIGCDCAIGLGLLLNDTFASDMYPLRLFMRPGVLFTAGTERKAPIE